MGENNFLLDDATSEKYDSTTNRISDFFSTEVQKNFEDISQTEEVDFNDVSLPETTSTSTSNDLNLSALPPISELEKIILEETESDSIERREVVLFKKFKILLENVELLY